MRSMFGVLALAAMMPSGVQDLPPAAPRGHPPDRSPGKAAAGKAGRTYHAATRPVSKKQTASSGEKLMKKAEKQRRRAEKRRQLAAKNEQATSE